MNANEWVFSATPDNDPALAGEAKIPPCPQSIFHFEMCVYLKEDGKKEDVGKNVNRNFFGQSSSVAERFHGKEKVESSILSSGSDNYWRYNRYGD